MSMYLRANSSIFFNNIIGGLMSKVKKAIQFHAKMRSLSSLKKKKKEVESKVTIPFSTIKKTMLEIIFK